MISSGMGGEQAKVGVYSKQKRYEPVAVRIDRQKKMARDIVQMFADHNLHPDGALATLEYARAQIESKRQMFMDQYHNQSDPFS
ncbi:hypothetical protein [Brevibacillus laterosporus]|uniref:hypothetical protein n=1 Tax=Brevibacillus laterosporus TaxID=1465 RepID=UPI0018CF339D|nr:hypothetical protein [Brevibacillus laterosporus]MBG9786912.1 hypothetical protein [Brevibacillus laterosporus]